MILTLAELKERLLNTKDPEELLECLQISSEELLDRFEDRIEDNYEKLLEEVEGEESDSQRAGRSKVSIQD